MEGNGEIGEVLGDCEEEKRNEPFVFKVVAEAKAAPEVGKRGKDRG